MLIIAFLLTIAFSIWAGVVKTIGKQILAKLDDLGKSQIVHETRLTRLEAWKCGHEKRHDQGEC